MSSPAPPARNSVKQTLQIAITSTSSLNTQNTNVTPQPVPVPHPGRLRRLPQSQAHVTRRGTKVERRSVFAIPNLLTFLALIGTIVTLYWTWTGTQTTVKLSQQEHLLHCREHDFASEYKNRSIPAECSEALRNLVPESSTARLVKDSISAEPITPSKNATLSSIISTLRL